eukprot:935025-Pyramimonas_sp.AAC.1
MVNPPPPLANRPPQVLPEGLYAALEASNQRYLPPLWGLAEVFAGAYLNRSALARVTPPCDLKTGAAAAATGAGHALHLS